MFAGSAGLIDGVSAAIDSAVDLMPLAPCFLEAAQFSN
jgi:hypothetical protein